MAERQLIRDVRAEIACMPCDCLGFEKDGAVCRRCVMLGMIDDGLAEMGTAEDLAKLLKTCNIYMDGEVHEVTDAADEWGIDLVLSAMKRLSMIAVDAGKYPIEQFREVLSQKVREAMR